MMSDEPDRPALSRQEVIERTGLFGPRREMMWVKMGWTPNLRSDPFAWRDKLTTKPRRVQPKD